MTSPYVCPKCGEPMSRGTVQTSVCVDDVIYWCNECGVRYHPDSEQWVTA